MSSQNIQIMALTKYSYEGPSSRYRYYNYVACFREHGIGMTISPLFTADYFSAVGKVAKTAHVLRAYFRRILLLCILLLSHRKYDLLIIEYELFPFFPFFFEWLLKMRGLKYLVDYDDAIFHRYDLHDSRVVRLLLGGKIGHIMRHAETVIVCNEYLGQYARQYNASILRLPTVVLLDRYQKATERHKAAEGTPFIIGWIGSKSTSAYLLDILPAIEKFASRYDVRFNFVGFDESVLPDGMKKRCKINSIAWSEETEIDEILNFDVGIMPLQSDPWSQGKCGFKLVQYMSCKKPVIASPVGMNTLLVENGVNGYLANTVETWLIAFEKLYADEQLRLRMAKANFIKILDHYNDKKNCQIYAYMIVNTVKKEKKT